MTDVKNRRVLRASPKVVLEQSKKYAKGALEHYNKTKEIKFELMDIMPVNSMREACNYYTHVNFTARSSKEGSQDQLFFAEVRLCSRRQASSRFFVTCCEPLGPDYTVGQRGFSLDRSVARKRNQGVQAREPNACTDLFGEAKQYAAKKPNAPYIAGHCNIP